jgi:hypothetical protein
MAGDWTKIRNDLPDSPEVLSIAGAMNIDPDTVVGTLLRVWVWAGAHTVTGTVRSRHARVTPECALLQIDHVAHRVGFGAAMASVAWLVVGTDGALVFPRWNRHNAKSAKQRALAAERAAKQRARNITQPSRSQRTKSAPREEKRRENTPLNPPHRGGNGFINQPSRKRPERMTPEEWARQGLEET